MTTTFLNARASGSDSGSKWKHNKLEENILHSINDHAKGFQSQNAS